jgi:hypothetical protein
MLMKTCGGCKETKGFGQFSKNKSKKDGLATQCKDCMGRYRNDNREKLNQQRKDYYHADPMKYRQDNSQKWKESGRDKQYSLIPGTIEFMLKNQEFKCGNPMCENDIDWSTSMVDHDHTCCPSTKSCGNCVRGLLCRGCNWALGNVNDNIDKLTGLIDYIMIYQEEV